jgi:tetratricopeptide (TPR) repeat protein
LKRFNWGYLSVAAVGLGAGYLAPDLREETNPQTEVGNLEIAESNAGASLFGEFRTSTAAWLYLRADRYLHNGVEMRALSEAERKAGRQGVGGDEDHRHASDKLHDDASIVTVIPSRERDYRGVFGDIERATSAYRGMHGHEHNDPQTVMPLFRLATWVDPRFITGWCLGAMVIAREERPDAVDRAIAYLKEGLRENPKSIEILTQLGSLHVARKADIPEGLRWLEKAREIARARKRARTKSEFEAGIECYRWLALVYQHEKRTADQYAAAAEGLERFSDDKVLLRLARPGSAGVPPAK